MYREIIRKAWQITWNNKFLWFFGFFAFTLSSGAAGAWNTVVSNVLRVMNQPQLFDDLSYMYSSNFLGLIAGNLKNGMSNFNTIPIVVVILFCLILVAVLWLSLTSQGAVIAGSALAEDKKKLSIEQCFTFGMSSFWRLLGLFIIAQLALYGAWLVIGLPLVSLYVIKGVASLATLFSVISFVVFVPLSMVVYFVLLYASVYTVINKTSLKESFLQGWKLFKKYWVPSLEFALILFVINVLVIFLFALLFIIPLILIVASQAVVLTFVLWSAIVMLVALILIIAVLATFQFSAVVVFMKRLESMEQPHGILGKLAFAIFGKK